MIDVLFFAELQDAVGSEKISVDAAGLTIAELKKNHLDSYNIATLDNAMVAVNEEYSQEDTILKEGDTVAFIPPVSGG